MDKIISELNKIGKSYINNDFVFDTKESFVYKNSGKNLSLAINLRKNESKQVKVINWFEDFWLYIEIRFIPVGSKKKKSVPNIFFSLSVFQGVPENNEKTQLFRAEWDNYEEISDNHPQPHWHIYPHKYSAQIHKDFEDFINLSKNDNDFEALLKQASDMKDIEIIDIKKFHFAMNGQWSDKELDVHTISSESDLTNWFAGILNHIKKELKYIKVE